MDINTLRIAITIVSLAAFLAVVLWAYLPARKDMLDRQARSILEDDAS